MNKNEFLQFDGMMKKLWNFYSQNSQSDFALVGRLYDAWMNNIQNMQE